MPLIHNHKDRLTKPLKRVGERGEDRWEEISYEQAMDEIASKLAAITQKYGPESFAVSTSGWNTQTTHQSNHMFKQRHDQAQTQHVHKASVVHYK